MQRLRDKIRDAAERIVRYEADGLEDADVVVVSYGITSRVARRAIDLARQGSVRVGSFRLITAWPFPENAMIRGIAAQVKALVAPEINLGQMVREVERAAAGRRTVIPVPHAGGSVHARKTSWKNPGGRTMSAVPINPSRALPAHGSHADIWCPGCGIGTSMNCFARALVDQKWTGSPGDRLRDRLHWARGRLHKLDSFHTTHGRAIPFATGLKLANPKLDGGGLLGRWRPVCDRRQSPHPRRAPQHRPEGHLRQQPDLRHDRRANGPATPRQS